MLVIPRRTEAKRLADLSRDEVADLFGSVQKIGSVMEAVHKASSLTVAIQVSLPGANLCLSHSSLLPS